MNCKNLEEKEAGFPVYGFYGGIFSGFVGNDLYHSRNQLRFPVGFPVLRSFDIKSIKEKNKGRVVWFL